MVVTTERAEEVKLKDELAPLRRLKEAMRAERNIGFEREKLFNEELTDIAEAIDHLYLESRFEYGFNGHSVVLPDGTALSEMYQRGVESVERLATVRPVFQFELERRRAESANQDLIDAMMRGQLDANTVVELSPYPEEAAKICEPRLMEDIGYKPNLKRGMVRIIHKESGDKVSLTTFSLDNSALELYQTLQTELDQTPDTNTTAMLANPVILTTSEKPADLVERLTKAYDEQLKAQSGMDYRRGRLGADGNSLTYIKDSKPVVDFYFTKLELLSRDWANESIGSELGELIAFMTDWRDGGSGKALLPAETSTQLKLALASRRLDEESASIIKRALEIGAWASIVNQLEYPSSVATASLDGILTSAHQAEQAGQRMVGCGGATSLFTSNRAEAMTSIFGAGLRIETRYSFDRLMYCVVHQKPPKVDPKTKRAESRSWCGPCGICRGCDAKLKKKSK